MKRKLIFLGAGFDVPAGIPTMLRFFPEDLEQCKYCWVLNFSDGRDSLRYTLEKRYRALVADKIEFQWDWKGMREPSTIPLWEDFLKI